MATHSSILAWEIPWTQEPGGHHKESDMTKAVEHTRNEIQRNKWLQHFRVFG